MGVVDRMEVVPSYMAGETEGTNLLLGAEFFLRSRQSLSYSRIPQNVIETDASLPCSQEPSSGPYSETH
jgi:hypothetical protein